MGSQDANAGDALDLTAADHGRNIGDGVGFPEFEHKQWTFEGEIERLGAFARGSHRVSGWRRTLAVVVAPPIVVTFVVGLVRLLADVIRFVTG